MEVSLQSGEEKSWASFDMTNFPVVNVKLSGGIRDQDDFNNFLKEWEMLNSGDPFVLNFDTRDVGWVSPKYAIKMSNFIKRIKRERNSMLSYSLIRSNSFWTKSLLRLIFSLEKPLAPVYVHNIDTSSFDSEIIRDVVDRKIGVRVYNP